MARSAGLVRGFLIWPFLRGDSVNLLLHPFGEASGRLTMWQAPQRQHRGPERRDKAVAILTGAQVTAKAGGDGPPQGVVHCPGSPPVWPPWHDSSTIRPRRVVSSEHRDIR